MQGVRFRSRQLGKLSPRAVHFLRQTNYELIGRATQGRPAHLRAYADRLRGAHEELQFRAPAFATYLLDVAAIADTAALLKESRRLVRHGSRLTWPHHHRAKFAQRGRS